MKNLSKLLLLTFILVLSACSGVQVTDYADNQPTLDPKQFFNGPLSAHGVVKNRSGKVIRYFNAELQGRWDGGRGILEEDFLFNDGEKQRRIWTLEQQEDGTFKATAGDVIGSASLELAGNSLFLDYVLQVPYGDGSINLRIDDRMYLVNDTVLINESKLTKWGVAVGSLSLVIIKH